MNSDNNYIEKLNRLFDSLSEFTDQDINDVKEFLKNVGIDPETLLPELKTRLKGIQARANRKIKNSEMEYGNESDFRSAFPVLKYNINTLLYELFEGEGLTDVLFADEAYKLFVTKEPTPERIGQPDETVSGIRFLKIPSELRFNIDLQSSTPSVSVFLKGLSKETFPLEVAELKTALTVGYFIHKKPGPKVEYIWTPINKENIAWAKGFVEKFNDKLELPLNEALSYFAQRDKFKWLKFENAEFDIEKICNEISISSHDSAFVRELYPYQKDGLKWLAYRCVNRVGGILADDMGLGKTAQTIALIAWILERNILEKVLIVVPGTLIENWRREFLLFAPSLIPYIHHGSGRTGSLNELHKHQIVITSYSIIVNDQYLLDKISWGLTLCDEASLIKNPDSERRIALSSIPSQVRIAMTGTPVENSLMDLWSLADYVTPGYLGTKEEFSSRYVQKDLEIARLDKNLGLLRDFVSFIMLRRKKEDVLDTLPERIDIHQALQMGQDEADVYEHQRQKLLSELGAASGVNIFKEILQLRLYTSHPFLIDHNKIQNANIQEISNSSIKFKRTIELVNEIKERNEKVLIFTEYLEMIDTFQRIMSQFYGILILAIDGRVKTEDRLKKIDSFSEQQGFSILLLNPRTAGMGLNITAANHVIHYTRQWNPALEEQATARSYRNGQKKGVNIYYLYYSDTIEEVIDNRLKAKVALSGEVIVSTSDQINDDDVAEILSKSPIIKAYDND